MIKSKSSWTCSNNNNCWDFFFLHIEKLKDFFYYLNKVRNSFFLNKKILLSFFFFDFSIDGGDEVIIFLIFIYKKKIRPRKFKFDRIIFVFPIRSRFVSSLNYKN